MAEGMLGFAPDPPPRAGGADSETVFTFTAPETMDAENSSRVVPFVKCTFTSPPGSVRAGSAVHPAAGTTSVTTTAPDDVSTMTVPASPTVYVVDVAEIFVEFVVICWLPAAVTDPVPEPATVSPVATVVCAAAGDVFDPLSERTAELRANAAAPAASTPATESELVIPSFMGTPSDDLASPQYERQIQRTVGSRQRFTQIARGTVVGAPPAVATDHNGGVKVLLVEDDRSIADSVVASLASAGLEVAHVMSGGAAIDALDLAVPDVVLLDLGLPDRDGLDVARSIRERSAVPIIIVSARGDELDRVLGLELGADDYVVKPFSQRELLARIRAVTRRGGGDAPEQTQAGRSGRLVIDERTRTAAVDGADIALTAKEFDLLAYLAAEPGVVFRRNDILEHVWDTNWYGTTKTLDAHVASLRKKLGHPDWIQAVRGVGFKYVETPE